jgi:hypothetical protein
MGHKGIGLLFLIGGILVWACGSFIAGKCKDKVNYSGIGHVKLTRAGIAYAIGYLVGCLLSVFGGCAALVSLFLIFG